MIALSFLCTQAHKVLYRQHLCLFVMCPQSQKGLGIFDPQGQPLINDHGMTNATVSPPIKTALRDETGTVSGAPRWFCDAATLHELCLRPCLACHLSPPGPTSPTPLPVVPWSLFLVNYFHTNSPCTVCFQETHIKHCESDFHTTFFLLRQLVFLFS